MEHTTQILRDLRYGEPVKIMEGGHIKQVNVNSVDVNTCTFDYIDKLTKNTVCVRHYQIVAKATS